MSSSKFFRLFVFRVLHVASSPFLYARREACDILRNTQTKESMALVQTHSHRRHLLGINNNADNPCYELGKTVYFCSSGGAKQRRATDWEKCLFTATRFFYPLFSATRQTKRDSAEHPSLHMIVRPFFNACPWKTTTGPQLG